MKINDLQGKTAKICKNSIRVIDDNGKTAGVITNAMPLQLRDAFTISGKYRGAVGLDATNCLANTRRVNGEFVFLGNIKSNKDRENAAKLSNAGILTVLFYQC